MRDIRFRGKYIKFDTWVGGSLTTFEGRPYILAFRRFDEDQLKFKAFEVIPETVGEYTGLYDKYGLAIFEGDIVKGHNFLHEDRLIYSVVYDQNGFYYRDEDDESWHPDNIDNVEVIGNIHDNPELMEVK